MGGTSSESDERVCWWEVWEMIQYTVLYKAYVYTVSGNRSTQNGCMTFECDDRVGKLALAAIVQRILWHLTKHDCTVVEEGESVLFILPLNLSVLDEKEVDV